MSLDAFQNEVHEWTEHTFGGYQEEPTLCHLEQKISEMLQSEDVGEAACCGILLCNYAARTGFSLQDAVNRELENRKWNMPWISGLESYVTILKQKHNPQIAARMMLVLWAFCETKNASLWHEMQKKHKINLKRPWANKDENGKSHHVEENA